MADYCSKCGSPLRENASFCTKCGTPCQEKPEALFCTVCGKQLRTDAKFCTACGTPVPQAGPEAAPQRQTPAPQKKKKIVYTMRKPKRRIGIPIAIASGVVVVALCVAAFFAFREGGFLRRQKPVEPVEQIETTTTTAAMLDYARRLEEMGNTEAAAVIYDRLREAGLSDMQKAAEQYGDDPRMLMLEALAGEDIYGTLTGERREPELRFTDVEEGSYYCEAALWAQENRVVTGSVFLPDEDCTRAQVLTFLWRAEGCPVLEDVECPFSDVTEVNYYYEAVRWALDKGMISASSDGLFRPGDSASRAMAVTFLYRAAGSPQTAYAQLFDDAPASAYFALPAVWAAQQGVVGSGGSFGPDDACTHAQFITMLYRFYRR